MVYLCTCVSGDALALLKLIHRLRDCLTWTKYYPSEASWFRLYMHLYCLIDTYLQVEEWYLPLLQL
jgi:hypothetical protein